MTASIQLKKAGNVWILVPILTLLSLVRETGVEKPHPHFLRSVWKRPDVMLPIPMRFYWR